MKKLSALLIAAAFLIGTTCIGLAAAPWCTTRLINAQIKLRLTADSEKNPPVPRPTVKRKTKQRKIQKPPKQKRKIKKSDTVAPKPVSKD